MITFSLECPAVKVSQLAQCSKCYAEVAVYDHFCPKCGEDVRGSEVRPNSERAKVRLCHLSALPGMVLVLAVTPVWWVFAFVPFNILVPLILRSNNARSPSVRQHLTEVLNFQVLWSALLYLLVLVWIIVGIGLWPFVWFGGIIMVLFMTYDAGNGGDGKYLVRIPVFK